MKVIYLSGPIKASTAWKREKNIRRAEDVSLWLMKQGLAVVCPHSMSRFFDGEMDYREFLIRDFAIMKRCDGAFFMTDWRTSHGCMEEHEFAEKNNIPVFYEGRMDAESLKAFMTWIEGGLVPVPVIAVSPFGKKVDAP